MAEKKTIGVITNPTREDYFREALKDYDLKLKSEINPDIVNVFAGFTMMGCQAIVVDDAAWINEESTAQFEETLLDLVESNPTRVIFTSPTRERENTFLYQLASIANVYDIVLDALEPDAASALVEHIEIPGDQTSVSNWITDDTKVLKRKKKRNRGLFSSLFSKQDKQPSITLAPPTQAELELKEALAQNAVPNKWDAITSPTTPIDSESIQQALNMPDPGYVDEQETEVFDAVLTEEYLAQQLGDSTSSEGPSPNLYSDDYEPTLEEMIEEQGDYILDATPPADATTMFSPIPEGAAVPIDTPFEEPQERRDYSYPSFTPAKPVEERANEDNEDREPSLESESEEAELQEQVDDSENKDVEEIEDEPRETPELMVEQDLTIEDAPEPEFEEEQMPKTTKTQKKQPQKRNQQPKRNNRQNSKQATPRSKREEPKQETQEQAPQVQETPVATSAKVDPAMLLNMGSNRAAPKANRTIAVGAIRRGIGCTHMSCALGIELAGQRLKSCVVFHDRTTLIQLRRALKNTKPIGENYAFRYRNCDFYYWTDQEAVSEQYDYVVADCGMIDLDENEEGAPSYFFKRANLSLFILSGAPWDLVRASNLFEHYNPDMLANWRWITWCAPKETIEGLRIAIATVSGNENFSNIWAAPFRNELFVTDIPKFSPYREILTPVLPPKLKATKKRASQEQREAQEKAGQ